MTDHAHTPGPRRHDPATGAVYATDVEREITIHEAPGSPGNESIAAEGRLIAAAPDLYEALAALADRCDGLGWPASWTGNARAALAKARGEAEAT